MSPDQDASEIETSLIRQNHFLIADALATIRFSGNANLRSIVDFCKSLFKIRDKKPDTFGGQKVDTIGSL